MIKVERQRQSKLFYKSMLLFESEIFRVFRPYWKLNRQTLKMHLDDVQLDLPELLFVTALVFYDYG